MHTEQSNEQNEPTAWILPKGLPQEDYMRAIMNFAAKNPRFQGGCFLAPGFNPEKIAHLLPADFAGGKQLTAEDCASSEAESNPTKERQADEPNIVYVNGRKVLVTSSEIGDSSDVLIPF